MLFLAFSSPTIPAQTLYHYYSACVTVQALRTATYTWPFNEVNFLLTYRQDKSYQQRMQASLPARSCFSVSHTLQLKSSYPPIMSRPLFENATDVMPQIMLSCEYMPISWSERMSNSRQVASSEPVAKANPLGKNWKQQTDSRHYNFQKFLTAVLYCRKVSLAKSNNFQILWHRHHLTVQ